MNSFFQKSFFLILGAVFVLVAVLFFVLWADLLKTRAQLSSVQANLTELDQTIEKTQNSIFSLQKEGYVKADDFGTVAEKVFPSVVFILEKSGVESSYNQSESALIGDDPRVRGTGFFISENGYVATAKHVVDDLTEATMEVQDMKGERFAVEKIFLDKKIDISVFKIKTTKKHVPVAIGYFQNLVVGAEIGTIGFNPGFNVPLLHKGTISAKGIDENGSSIFTINSFANKGNSGSPIFSLKTGRVLGILSARQSETQTQKLLDPSQFHSSVSLGGIGDPLQLSVQLYNETVKTVQEVSQVGIGIVYSVESALALMPH